MRIVKYIILVGVIYIYLYNPIFRKLGFGSIKPLLVLSFLYIIASGFFNKFLSLFKYETILVLLLISYSVPLILIGENSIAIPYSHLVWFLECFLIPTSIILIFKDFFNHHSWESLVVPVGFIASLITLFLILNPEINQFVRETVIDDTLDKVVTSTSKMDFRGFTIAESSSYGYGIVQGLMLSICLFSIRKQILFAIPIAFLFVSIIFNARIGLVSIIITFLLLIYYNRLKFKYLLVIIVIILAGLWFFQFSSFAEQNEASLKWAFSVFTNFDKFIKGQDDSSAYNSLLNEWIFFPSDFIGLLFGNGEKVFASSVRQSDVGYVIQIFRGGIIYLAIMFYFLWILFKRSMNYNSDKLLSILFILTILVANIKGNAFFQPNGFFRLFMFYYIYTVLKSKNILNCSISAKKILAR